MSDPILHVYGQEFWHTPATIVLNSRALELLISMAHRAQEMDNELELTIDVFAVDGEGYEFKLICTDKSEAWEKMRLPYTDEDAADRRPYSETLP